MKEQTSTYNPLLLVAAQYLQIGKESETENISSKHFVQSNHKAPKRTFSLTNGGYYSLKPGNQSLKPGNQLPKPGNQSLNTDNQGVNAGNQLSNADNQGVTAGNQLLKTGSYKEITLCVFAQASIHQYIINFKYYNHGKKHKRLHPFRQVSA